MMAEVVGEMVTVDELAVYLRVNRKTIYDMVKLGELPGAQFFRGAIRIHKPTVVAWMETGKGPVNQRKRAK